MAVNNDKGLMRYSHFFTLISLGVLTACNGSEVKDTLGLNRSAPDEFRVVTRPPLSVPPQFNLRPPAAPGEASSMAADKQAKSLITGTPAESENTFRLQPAGVDTAVAPVEVKPVATAGKTTPENNLLDRAGAMQADPNVRQAIEQDKIAAHQTIEEEDSWWSIFSTMPKKKDPMVDAKQEAERLKKNKEEGKPIDEGETPEVKPKDTGVLGRILGY